MSKKFCAGILREMEDHELGESRMVTVTDDWCPCFPDNQVCLSIRAYKGCGRTYYVRVSAFGADDMGVALYYTSSSPEYVYGLYKHWKQWIYDRVPDGVDVGWFYEHGFWMD